jgi:hypothetical protein
MAAAVRKEEEEEGGREGRVRRERGGQRVLWDRRDAAAQDAVPLTLLAQVRAALAQQRGIVCGEEEGGDGTARKLGADVAGAQKVAFDLSPKAITARR